MFQLRVKDHFDAAHYIVGYPGKCARLHGHTWVVEVVVEGEELNDLSMLMDFKTIKAWLKGTFDLAFDHVCLNESLRLEQVTAEIIAQLLFNQLKDWLQKKGFLQIHLVQITVNESSDCGATYHD